MSIGNAILQTLARAIYEGVKLNFTVRANTGRLYSMRSGRDLNGDQSSSDRSIGVARNTEVGPANWNLNMTLTKDYRLRSRLVEAAAGGGELASDSPRLRFQVRANNVLNHAQARRYGSVVTSPLFGLPTGYLAGRTVNLSMNLEF